MSEEIKLPTNAVSFVRNLDEEGFLRAETKVVAAPDGTLTRVPVLKRDQYLDADDLLDEIRSIVRQEIANAYMKFKHMAETT